MSSSMWCAWVRKAGQSAGSSVRAWAGGKSASLYWLLMGNAISIKDPQKLSAVSASADMASGGALNGLGFLGEPWRGEFAPNSDQIGRKSTRLNSSHLGISY